MRNRLWQVCLWMTLMLMCGSASAQAQSLVGDRLILITGGCELNSASGTPAGTYTGSVCDWYRDISTGDLYLKTSGTATTSGWSLIPRVDALNTFTANQSISTTAPQLALNETDAASGSRLWRIQVDGTGFVIQGLNDAGTSVTSNAFNLTRAGALTLLSGLTAGSGAVGIIDAAGKIPALSSVYIGNLSGANLTALPAGQLTGTITSSVQDNITRAGALGSGSITSGFGSIDVGADPITGGAITGTTGSFSSTLHTGGNLDVASTKFTVAAATGNTVIAGTEDVTGAATFASNVGTSTYASQVTGWRITSGGDADFRSAYSDAMIIKSFMTQFEQVSVGGQIETKSVGVIASPFTVPAGGAAVTSITRIGAVATVTTTTVHGFSSGDLAYLTGAVQTEYNGLYSITVTDTTHFTYAVSGTPVSPATGTITAAGASLLVVEDFPSAPDIQIFAAGDAVVLRTHLRVGGASSGLIIGDAVGIVLAPDVTAAGTQTWTFVRTIATPGSLARGTIIAAKSLALDYGTTGSGYLESVVIDGTIGVVSITRVSSTATLTTSSPHGYQTGDVVYVSGAAQNEYNGGVTITVTSPTEFTYSLLGSPATPATGTILVDLTNGTNAPYYQIVTWTTAPVAANKVVRCRMGNIRGITGVLEYGLFCGSYAGTNGSYFRATSSNFDLHGITAKWWDAATNVVTISPNSGSPYIGIGNPAPSTCCTTAGIFLGWDHSATKAKASFYADANNFWTYDGSKVTWKAANTTLDASGNLTATSATLSGAITSTSGSIGGWSIGATTLTATNIALTSGAANTANILVGTGSNAGGLNSANAASDIAIWAGATFANRATAPFRVRADGAATMTSVAITAGGATLDTNGLFISPIAASGGGTYTNANAVRWTTDTTYRTAIWRSDDTSASPTRNFHIDHIQDNSVVFTHTDIETKNAAAVGGYYGRGLIQSRAQLNMTGESQITGESSIGTKTAFAYVGSGNSPGLQYAVLGLGAAAPMASSTAPGGYTLDMGVEVTLSATNVIGNLTISGDMTSAFNLKNSLLMDWTNASFEHGNRTASNTPFIDFHSSGNNIDYDSRLLASGGTGSSGNGQLNFFSGRYEFNIAGVNAFSVTSAGKFRFGTDAPTSISGDYIAQFRNASATGHGLQILGGSTSSEFAFYVLNYLGGGLLYVAGDGSVVVGAPTGGTKGAGTVNAQAVYDDNVLLTDWVFDLAYNEQPAAPRPPSRRLYTMADVARTTRLEHRLPWMPKASEFENARVVGGMVTRLYQGQEQQQLYILELETRIAALERVKKSVPASSAKKKPARKPVKKTVKR